jgi:hypothetical protein
LPYLTVLTDTCHLLLSRFLSCVGHIDEFRVHAEMQAAQCTTTSPAAAQVLTCIPSVCTCHLFFCLKDALLCTLIITLSHTHTYTHTHTHTHIQTHVYNPECGDVGAAHPCICGLSMMSLTDNADASVLCNSPPSNPPPPLPPSRFAPLLSYSPFPSLIFVKFRTFYRTISYSIFMQLFCFLLA